MASYDDELKALAESIGSDGCTHATQIHQVCCWEHDWAYATGTTPRGIPITKQQADRRFRDCNQAHSPCRFLSPLAWWRWTAVHWLGKMHVAPVPGPLLALACTLYPPPLEALAAARAARARMADEDR